MTFKQSLKWSTLLFATTVANAAGSPARISWNELSMRVTPKHIIRMVLTDGIEIEGNALQFKPDAIEMRLTRAFDKQAYPKGNVRIPRELVSVVQVRIPRQRGRLIGTIAPIAIGAAMAIGASAERDESKFYGHLIYGSAIAGIGAPAGFFVGRAIDKHFDEFVIIPERRSAEPNEPQQ